MQANFNPKYAFPVQGPDMDKLPKHPLWEQLKEHRFKLKEVMDVTELNREYALPGVDLGEIDNVPLDEFFFDNPIYAVDDPSLRWEAPDQLRDEDMPEIRPYDPTPLDTLLTKQYHLEAMAYSKQALKFKKGLSNITALGKSAELFAVTRVVLEWFEDMKRVVDIRVKQLVSDFKEKESLTTEEEELMAFWTAVKTEKLVIITCHEVLGVDFRKEVAPLKVVAGIIGDTIQAEINYERMTLNEKQTFEVLKGKQISVRKINNYTRKLFGESAEWSKKVKQQVGTELIYILSQIATYEKTTYNPDTQSSTQEESSPILIEEKKGEKTIVIDDAFLDQLTQSLHMSDIAVRHYPMVVPPLPWTNPIDGGYITTRIPIIRYIAREQLKPLFRRADGMKHIYDGLNALSSTAWKLNKRIVEIMETIWYLGGDMVEVPPRFDLEPPQPGPEGQTPQWFKAVKRTEKTNIDNNSLRGAFLLKLDAIRMMKKEPKFYYPYNMDFRGRVYPIPAHLNHIGSDLGRGLMMFAEPKRLGVRGFQWLQIHIATLAGLSKATHDERIAYVQEHIEEIMECALQPLSGSRSWMQKDDPWQYLAACIEFTNALNEERPEDYECALPIHQDGSCNGLQHYSALGGDPLGAKSVNVLPSERPQDVYNDVCAMVEERVAKDRRDGVPIAKVLEGKIQRAVIKQTVMTSVYGVTFIGARKQIQSNLLSRFPNFPEEHLFEATLYIARHTFDALDEMFHGAKAIMEWLSVCANIVCKGGNSLAWVTPLGLPVQQPYRKTKKQEYVKTLAQTVVLQHEEDLTVNPRRNGTAFPPNYVHSLDSTHMFLTALECNKRGITYASVHDSFWTHACDVDDMNEILRDSFIKLYKRPLLEELRDYWLSEDPSLHIPPVPKTGKGFDLDLVSQSKYFFS
eukprot:TRINITY_DN5595_c0_g1_i1.p1 TRINITY_DN5595_c0_g1~~TRINITY_DN5595_c0_g1_i1.p1  ORF type:complete len:970 (-),score=195.17 TRINITY_DN5595_c0_g1_i1:17-2752(-)